MSRWGYFLFFNIISVFLSREWNKTPPNLFLLSWLNSLSEYHKYLLCLIEISCLFLSFWWYKIKPIVSLTEQNINLVMTICWSKTILFSLNCQNILVSRTIQTEEQENVIATWKFYSVFWLKVKIRCIFCSI